MLLTLSNKLASSFSNIYDFISNIFFPDTPAEFSFYIPNCILHRTELICKYISDEHNCNFSIENFLMLLYLDFIKNSIKNYNPESTFKLLTKDYYKDTYLYLSNGTNKYKITTQHYEKTLLTISIDKNDVAKGQLILDELYDLYKFRIPFSKLIENLWIGFIEDYKTGTTKRAYYSLIKLLKDTLE